MLNEKHIAVFQDMAQRVGYCEHQLQPIAEIFNKKNIGYIDKLIEGKDTLTENEIYDIYGNCLMFKIDQNEMLIPLFLACKNLPTAVYDDILNYISSTQLKQNSWGYLDMVFQRGMPPSLYERYEAFLAQKFVSIGRYLHWLPEDKKNLYDTETMIRLAKYTTEHKEVIDYYRKTGPEKCDRFEAFELIHPNEDFSEADIRAQIDELMQMEIESINERIHVEDEAKRTICVMANPHVSLESKMQYYREYTGPISEIIEYVPDEAINEIFESVFFDLSENYYESKADSECYPAIRELITNHRLSTAQMAAILFDLGERPIVRSEKEPREAIIMLLASEATDEELLRLIVGYKGISNTTIEPECLKRMAIRGVLTQSVINTFFNKHNRASIYTTNANLFSAIKVCAKYGTLPQRYYEDILEDVKGDNYKTPSFQDRIPLHTAVMQSSFTPSEVKEAIIARLGNNPPQKQFSIQSLMDYVIMQAFDWAEKYGLFSEFVEKNFVPILNSTTCIAGMLPTDKSICISESEVSERLYKLGSAMSAFSQTGALDDNKIPEFVDAMLKKISTLPLETQSFGAPYILALQKLKEVSEKYAECDFCNDVFIAKYINPHHKAKIIGKELVDRHFPVVYSGRRRLDFTGFINDVIANADRYYEAMQEEQMAKTHNIFEKIKEEIIK